MVSVSLQPGARRQGQITRWYWRVPISKTVRELKRDWNRKRRSSREIDKASMFEEIIGAHRAEGLLSRVSKVAGSDSTVLITGETGNRKGAASRGRFTGGLAVLRERSWRELRRYSRDLIASELFGHEKGRSPAVQRQLGRFELADGGTIFLDEVGDSRQTCRSRCCACCRSANLAHRGETDSPRRRSRHRCHES